MDIEAALQILELPRNASAEEIKDSYRSLVSVWHPDRFEGNPKLRQKAEDKLKLINAAYDLINQASASSPALSRFAEYEQDELLLQGYAHEMGDEAEFDMGKAMDLYKRSADLGNPIAQLALALIYHADEKGVSKNPALTMTFARLAADKGLPEAQSFLGDLYDQGDGIAANPTEAVKWYGKAAEQGHGVAQLMLANAFLEGSGVAKDEGEGIRWLMSAAKLKVSGAFYALGLVHANGKLPVGSVPVSKSKGFWGAFTEGYRQQAGDLEYNGKRNHLQIPVNLIWAHKWMTLAVMSEHPMATAAISNLESLMTFEEIEAARCQFGDLLEQYGVGTLNGTLNENFGPG